MYVKTNDLYKQFISWLNDLSGDYGALPTTSSTDGTDLLTTWFLILTASLLITSIFIIVAILIWNRRKSNNRMPTPELIPFRQLLNQHNNNGNRAVADSVEGSSLTVLGNAIHHEEGLILLREWIQLEEEIGQGCFGQVYRGRYRRPGASSTDPPLCDELHH